jgi:hypothetical protein
MRLTPGVARHPISTSSVVCRPARILSTTCFCRSPALYCSGGAPGVRGPPCELRRVYCTKGGPSPGVTERCPVTYTAHSVYKTISNQRGQDHALWSRFDPHPRSVLPGTTEHAWRWRRVWFVGTGTWPRASFARSRFSSPPTKPRRSRRSYAPKRPGDLRGEPGCPRPAPRPPPRTLYHFPPTANLPGNPTLVKGPL